MSDLVRYDLNGNHYKIKRQNGIPDTGYPVLSDIFYFKITR